MVQIQELSFPLAPAEDYRSIDVNVSDVGISDVGDVSGWKCLSWVRNKPTWVEPTLYSSLREHSRLASFLLLLKSPDWKTTVAVYPVSSLEADAFLVAGADHAPGASIKVEVRRNVPDVAAPAGAIIGVAHGPVEERSLIRRLVQAARRHSHGKAPATEWVDDLWSGLGVCTWESFRDPHDLSKRTRPNKDLLLSLVPPPSIPLKSFLIDDGWQDVKNRRLVSSEAWDGMHDSLGGVVKALKATGVEEVGVWLTLQGYWEGIHPDSHLIKKYDCVAHPQSDAWSMATQPVSPGDATNEWWLPSPEKAGLFWDDYLHSLKSAGVDYIKCDNQANYDSIRSPTGAQTAVAMWSGMLAAVTRHFGSLDKVIMCMSHNARMLCGPGGLDFSRPSGLLYWRNSDDYALSYAQTHPDHVRKNLYMAALSAHLSMRPDPDMFASTPKSAWPVYHMLLRALSPGPVLLSDTSQDKTDEMLLRKMSAKDTKGVQRLVKTDTTVQVLPGRLFWDNLAGAHAGPAVVGYVRFPRAHGAIIAAWNAHDPESNAIAHDSIKLDDVEDALEVVARSASDNPSVPPDADQASAVDTARPQIDGEFAIWSVGLSARNGQRAELIRPGGHLDFGLELRKGECESMVVAKVWEVKGRKVAVLGMLEKFAPLAELEVMVKDDELIIKQRYVAPVSLLLSDVGSGGVQASVNGCQWQGVSVEQTPGDLQLVTLPIDSALSVPIMPQADVLETRVTFA